MTEHENFDTGDFDLDVALSADLDGELAAYAAELQTDEATLRARIAAEPGTSERRVQLVGAHDALATPGPALDEVTRARLVAHALAASQSGSGTGTATRGARPSGWYLRAAAAAAAVLVVVGGIVTLVTHDGGSDGAAKSAATSGGSVRSGNIGDIGNIDQKKLDQLVGGPPAGSSAPSATAAPKDSAPESAQTVDGFDQSAPVRAAPDQVTRCTQAIANQGTVRFNGSGAYKGEPAVIVGVAAGKRTVVFVVAASDCTRVLYSVSR